jgi:hypothetical protein
MHGQLIDVGGHRLHIECSGTGSPTVVLEAAIAARTAPAWAKDLDLMKDCGNYSIHPIDGYM